jgi:hypothetical protein
MTERLRAHPQRDIIKDVHLLLQFIVRKVNYLVNQLV